MLRQLHRGHGFQLGNERPGFPSATATLQGLCQRRKNRGSRKRRPPRAKGSPVSITLIIRPDVIFTQKDLRFFHTQPCKAPSSTKRRQKFFSASSHGRNRHPQQLFFAH